MFAIAKPPAPCNPAGSAVVPAHRAALPLAAEDSEADAEAPRRGTLCARDN